MMNKKIIILFGSMILILVFVFVIFQEKSLQLKNKEVIIEYGHPVSKEVSDYLDFDKVDSAKKDDILAKAKLEMNIENEVEKEYPAVGQYTITITYQKETIDQLIIVKDTIAPEFIELQKIYEVELNKKIESSLFKTSDLSQTQIMIEDSQVNYQKEGTYQASISASDSYHNKTVKEIEVSIKNRSYTDYVKVKDYIPSLFVDLKYATNDNFTKQKIYNFNEAYLRYGTVLKLQKVQEELNGKGYSLLIWDAYRPFEAQKKLWEVVSDSRYVANPSNGPKSHNLGGTVDITIVKLNGEKISVPTEFDDFSKRADRDYSDITNQEAVRNAKLLQSTMYKYGFTGYKNEWWDYSDSTTYKYIDFQPK